MTADLFETLASERLTNSIVVVPFAYGIAGGLVTAVAAALYNAVAAVVGGLRVELRATRYSSTRKTTANNEKEE